MLTNQWLGDGRKFGRNVGSKPRSRGPRFADDAFFFFEIAVFLRCNNQASKLAPLVAPLPLLSYITMFLGLLAVVLASVFLACVVLYKVRLSLFSHKSNTTSIFHLLHSSSVSFPAGK